jgi:hypothetical protein
MHKDMFGSHLSSLPPPPDVKLTWILCFSSSWSISFPGRGVGGVGVKGNNRTKIFYVDLQMNNIVDIDIGPFTMKSFFCNQVLLEKTPIFMTSRNFSGV